jgi:UDP-4-amino-4-deoxy-L-arabinose formyltransferase/UDP-glucuronic acid dehydrogenase (UDP-4-keto-hexauronic acid decarboxylating)
VLVNGESETGVTLHRMVNRADAGDIVAQQSVAIGADDAALTLHRKLCAAASELLARRCRRSATAKPKSAPRMKARRPTLVAVRRKMAASTGNAGADAAQPGACGLRSVAGRVRLRRREQVYRLEIPRAPRSGRAKPGTVISVAPLVVACQEGALEIVTGQTERGVYMQGTQLAQALGLVPAR